MPMTFYESIKYFFYFSIGQNSPLIYNAVSVVEIVCIYLFMQ